MDQLPTQDKLNDRYTYNEHTGILYFKNHKFPALIGKGKVWDGKKGIAWHKLNNKWIVRVPKNLGEPKHLGYFKTYEEAYNELYNYLNSIGITISSNCVRSSGGGS